MTIKLCGSHVGESWDFFQERYGQSTTLPSGCRSASRWCALICDLDVYCWVDPEIIEPILGMKILSPQVTLVQKRPLGLEGRVSGLAGGVVKQFLLQALTPGVSSGM